jgi:hypothetical protein
MLSTLEVTWIDINIGICSTDDVFKVQCLIRLLAVHRTFCSYVICTFSMN